MTCWLCWVSPDRSLRARQLGATLVSTDERLKRAPNLGVQVLRLATDQ